jgi:hypothetical protein
MLEKSKLAVPNLNGKKFKAIQSLSLNNNTISLLTNAPELSATSQTKIFHCWNISPCQWRLSNE